MKLRIVSDVHTEFFKDQPFHKFKSILDNILPPMEDEKDQTLIVAGDLGSARGIHAIKLALEHWGDRFREILYTPGNHEYYGGQMPNTDEDIREAIQNIENVYFGNDAMFIAGGKTVHLNTLWTDFDGGKEISMVLAELGMNDYRVCRGPHGRTLKPSDTLSHHKLAVAVLQKTIRPGDIVVTHHLPSFRSVDPEYTTSDLNGAYASDLEWLMLEKEPALWIHGHTHVPCDYTVGKTRVVCNPRGYAGQEKNGFNGKLVVEV